MGSAEPIRDDELAAIFASLPKNRPFVLAVSGGADSVALLMLYARWTALSGFSDRCDDGRDRAVVATVDHGLRPEAAAEAVWVERLAARLGLKHTTLVWDDPKPGSRVQAQAREARYRLLHRFSIEDVRLAEAKGTERSLLARAIVTAHHQDDQAETLLLRLARGSGVQGLASMAKSTRGALVAGGGRPHIVRPLLNVSKARLIATLRKAGQSWCEDSSNENLHYERVRIRAAREQLNDIGLSSESLGLSAQRLQRAWRAIQSATDDLAVEAALEVHNGAFADVEFEPVKSAPDEIGIQLLMRIAGAFGGQIAPPRLSVIEDLYCRFGHETALTGAGCIFKLSEGKLRVWREWGRQPLETINIVPGDVQVWDNRFEIGLAAKAQRPLTVQALGKADFDQLRGLLPTKCGLPLDAGPALPSIWDQGTLVAVPHLALDLPQFAGPLSDGKPLIEVNFVAGGLVG